MIKALVAAAIKGDMRATNAIVSFCTRAFGNEPEDAESLPPAPDDLEILNEFVGREVRRRAARAGAEDTQSQPHERKTSDES